MISVKKLPLCLIAVLFLVACEPYRYMPQNDSEKAATIQYSLNGAWTHDPLFGGDYMLAAETKNSNQETLATYIKWIDGKHINGERSNPQIKDNTILLSPGLRKIELKLVSSTRRGGGSFEFLINVKPSEQYRLGLTHQDLWIEDSRDQVVSKISFQRKTTSLPITVRIPK